MSFYIDDGEIYFDSEGGNYSLQDIIDEYSVEGSYNSTLDTLGTHDNNVDTWKVTTDYNLTTSPQDKPTTDVNVTTAVEGGTILNLYGNYEVQIFPVPASRQWRGPIPHRLPRRRPGFSRS